MKQAWRYSRAQVDAIVSALAPLGRSPDEVRAALEVLSLAAQPEPYRPRSQVTATARRNVKRIDGILRDLRQMTEHFDVGADAGAIKKSLERMKKVMEADLAARDQYEASRKAANGTTNQQDPVKQRLPEAIVEQWLALGGKINHGPEFRAFFDAAAGPVFVLAKNTFRSFVVKTMRDKGLPGRRGPPRKTTNQKPSLN